VLVKEDLSNCRLSNSSCNR